jgi:hypothetical protein
VIVAATAAQPECSVALQVAPLITATVLPVAFWPKLGA